MLFIIQFSQKITTISTPSFFFHTSKILEVENKKILHVHSCFILIIIHLDLKKKISLFFILLIILI